MIRLDIPDIPSPAEMEYHLRVIMRGLNRQLFGTLGDRVVAGIFTGMRIPELTVWGDGNASCKLLGSYEFELQDVLLKAVKRDPDTVVNVGCAEGYYAIGAALGLPHAQIIAMDIDDRSLDLCREYATLNGVNNRIKTLIGAHKPEELNAGGRGHHLFIVDCEGSETELIDTQCCPILADSDIIVECHDFFDEKRYEGQPISGILRQRLEVTHEVELIKPRLPNYEHYSFLTSSPTIMMLLAVTEKRPMPTCWLACWSKQRNNSLQASGATVAS